MLCCHYKPYFLPRGCFVVTTNLIFCLGGRFVVTTNGIFCLGEPIVVTTNGILTLGQSYSIVEYPLFLTF